MTIQSNAVWSTATDFFLGCCWQLAGGELIISDLDQPIPGISSVMVRNYPDAFISAFSTIIIATGLNVIESLYVIDQHNKLLFCLKHAVVA